MEDILTTNIGTTVNKGPHFNFTSSVPEDDINEITNSKKNLKWHSSKEIIPSEGDILIKKILEDAKVYIMTIGDNEINYLCTSHVLHVLQSEENLREYSAFRAEQNHSDLLPAIYEGGLKIWECTYDLLKYINEAKLDFKNKRVLDLGCGTGIIGIFTLTQESFCNFQDYNSDVIKYVTIPNVLLNKKELNRCKFYSGDWQSLSDLLKTEITNEEKYDFIFTSETIYNTENYIKLHQVFETLLKKNGAIFLAAKSFYFGVGGGITLFEDFLEQQKIFKYSSCWKCEEGVKREILKIEFNS